MLHYTLNTADTADLSSKKYDRSALKTLRPIATRAVEYGKTKQQLPPPFDDYNVIVTLDDGCGLFDTYAGEQIINTNAIAWTQSGSDRIWELFEQFYLQQCAKFDMVLASRAPVCPNRLPWLTTLILPSPAWVALMVGKPDRGDSAAAIGLTWLADFEQCLTIAIIDEANRPKFKGFGKTTR
jgi:hypothetical protein